MIDCATMETIGDKRLALEICPILRRKHFSVGTLSDGTAVYAVANDMLRFIIPNSPQGAAVKASSAVPDLELTVSRLPNGQEAHATIVLAIDPSGIVTDCDGFGPKPNPALIKVACNQRSVFNGAIEYDGGGKPIPYVTIRKIEFRTATEVPDKNN